MGKRREAKKRQRQLQEQHELEDAHPSKRGCPGEDISETDLQAAIRVLSKLGNDPAMLQAPRFRLLRTALHPVVEGQMKKCASGSSGMHPAQHQTRADTSSEEALKAQDRELINSRTLRAGARPFFTSRTQRHSAEYDGLFSATPTAGGNGTRGPRRRGGQVPLPTSSFYKDPYTAC
jgi:hypothetical protein